MPHQPMTSKDRPLPCGCRTCGCACADHAPPIGWRCARHVAAGLAQEGAALVATTLFVGMVLVWCAIICGPFG